MLLLEEISRVGAERVRCRILCEGVPMEFTIHFEQIEPAIRALNLEGISDIEIRQLSNRDDYRSLKVAFCAFMDGASLVLPMTIEGPQAE